MQNFSTNISTGANAAIATINSAGQQFATALSNFGLQTNTSAVAAGAQTRAGGTALSTQIQTTGTQVAVGTQTAATAVGTAGGMFQSMLSMFWPMLIMMGITAIINRASKASGGFIYRAGGGIIDHMAGGGMKRDRVPAMLEPGEFVVRKPIVNAVGLSNMQSLNATGRMQPASAPVINFKNEGSAKEVEAAPPRFDGEKYVIDIITRDLAKNGPIRRTLRGGI
jgi:hypothetical protein